MSAVRLEMKDTVATVVLDRPPLNVIDLATANQLVEAIEQAAAEPVCAVLVLEARGRAFSAGVDVRDHLPDRGAEMLRAFDRACIALLEFDAPTIAVVQGVALGGGCELTLVCDLVVASSAAEFALPEIKLGVFPPVAAVMLRSMIPAHLAAEMILLGRRLSAQEAHAAGLVNHVAAPDELKTVADGLVSQLLALSPRALEIAKNAMGLARNAATGAEIEAAEKLYVDALLHDPDAIEGLEAFLEKRPPEWRS
jgi:cyclohexa-1,5-dienecarbonyl-CoA hydratase